MVQRWQNQSYDYLIDGKVVDATRAAYEGSFTFGGVIYFWPIFFLFTLIIVSLKSESPTMVAIYGLLGNVALKAFLPALTNKIFAVVVIFSVMIWLYSLFGSQKSE